MVCHETAVSISLLGKQTTVPMKKDRINLNFIRPLYIMDIAFTLLFSLCPSTQKTILVTIAQKDTKVNGNF